MRDMSNLLWCDLTSNEERLEFIISGRATDTGIVARVMIADLVEVYSELLRLQDFVRQIPST
ncbi:MAG: hypothetical protein ACK5AC_11365 [Planctomycetota bacterium]|jgi:hypothetical protein